MPYTVTDRIDTQIKPLRVANERLYRHISKATKAWIANEWDWHAPYSTQPLSIKNGGGRQRRAVETRQLSPSQLSDMVQSYLGTIRDRLVSTSPWSIRLQVCLRMASDEVDGEHDSRAFRGAILAACQWVGDIQFPSSAIWEFAPCGGNTRSFDPRFSGLACKTTGSTSDTKLIVCAMGPQELSDEDFKEFHRLEKTEGLSDPYTKAETTWAAIHDRCYNSDSRYFILTNYNMWILGSFSPNLSVVYQTPLMCCDQKDPTMMQCLALWIAMAASATPNPLRFPEDEPADYDEVPCTFGDLAKCPAEELAELYAVASLY